jgi:hypothetical protein
MAFVTPNGTGGNFYWPGGQPGSAPASGSAPAFGGGPQLGGPGARLPGAPSLAGRPVFQGDLSGAEFSYNPFFVSAWSSGEMFYNFSTSISISASISIPSSNATGPIYVAAAVLELFSNLDDYQLFPTLQFLKFGQPIYTYPLFWPPSDFGEDENFTTFWAGILAQPSVPFDMLAGFASNQFPPPVAFAFPPVPMTIAPGMTGARQYYGFPFPVTQDFDQAVLALAGQVDDTRSPTTDTVIGIALAAFSI